MSNKKARPEIYVSVDIETDGPIPGEYSMLSLGAVAFAEDGLEIDKFYKKLERLPGAKQHPATMEFWKRFPEAYEEAITNQEDVQTSMKCFRSWAKELAKKGSVVFVAYPAGFDWTFVYWYLVKYCGDSSPFGFQCLDMKTYAMSKLVCKFKESHKRGFPHKWFSSDYEHDHTAITDALHQGRMFMRMLEHGKEEEDGDDPDKQ